MGSTYSDVDPFKLQLDTMDRVRKQQGTESAVMAIISAVTFLGGVVFQNLGSFGVMDKQTANWIATGCYVGAGISIGFDIGQFITVNQTNDDYMKLLRLQTQYYNMIHDPFPSK